MTSLETRSPAASVARVEETVQSLREMAAVVRVLFGVGLQRSPQPAQPAQPDPEPLQPPAAQPATMPASVPASVPVPPSPPHDVPVSQPAAPASVPLPEPLPVEAIALPTPAAAGAGGPAAIPVPGLAPQPAQHPDHDVEPERRSLAMLHEIAFLDD